MNTERETKTKRYAMDRAVFYVPAKRYAKQWAKNAKAEHYIEAPVTITSSTHVTLHTMKSLSWRYAWYVWYVQWHHYQLVKKVW